MNFTTRITSLLSLLTIAGLSLSGLTGCATVEQNVALGVIGSTAYLGRTPSTEIQQIYYLGSFDPQGQDPPTIYRVRVHGQASAISATKFASGWVKSELIDSLGSTIDFSGTNKTLKIDPNQQQPINFNANRRLVLFGPEGFREAPKDHRLVIVMGSSPEAYFQAIDESLGVISEVKAQAMSEGMSGKLFQALYKMDSEQESLENLSKDVAADLGEDSVKKGGNQ